MYTKPAGELIERHNANYHCYADDAQMYTALKMGGSWADTPSLVEVCPADISHWMNGNTLKLSHSKTEFIVFSHKKHTKKTGKNVILR